MTVAVNVFALALVAAAKWAYGRDLVDPLEGVWTIVSFGVLLAISLSLAFLIAVPFRRRLDIRIARVQWIVMLGLCAILGIGTVRQLLYL